MSSPADDIKTVLENNGVATFATDLFISKEPTSPDNCITLYDTGGYEANPKWSMDEPTVMARIRNNSYPDGYAKCEEIKDALLGLPKQAINSTTYVGVWMEGEINFIEYDDNGRAIFTMNFRIVREPTESGNRQSL